MIDDATAITDIYNTYIKDSSITFEETLIDIKTCKNRLAHITQTLGLPWIVFIENGQLLGYAYANQWKERSAYRHAVEVTVYLHPNHKGKGIGYRLYQELFQRLGKLDIHCALAVITLPNAASVALHEKLGMKKAAHFPEVGFKFSKWHDVGYWHTIIDR
ncbi:GNAT family N-acetyltransferase [Thalassotalea litorea]|uniref:GNAT family N-acetyltransferase n=1 Tax=Thalassotalea litorea TaxID=2020715 RepID=UPI003735FE5B